ncbi:MAG: hypothetical protein M3R07_09255 [Gemmatimonadota bacterium]|nr:hypothetical protein [Gemmatimonadota bacterium]
MIVIGELSLWVALILATWSAAVSFIGASLGRRDLVASGERAIFMTLMMVSLACAGVWVALFTHEFAITHVASFSSRNLPSLLLVSALWAGRAGGLLFCAVCLAIVSTLVVRTSRRSAWLPYATATLGFALGLVLVALCFAANPFARLDWIPQEGQGMPPQLQNVWTSLYQPVLYAGATSLAAPVALWIGARRLKQIDDDALALIRKWALVAWIITTCAVIMGIRQAYAGVDLQASWLSHPLRSGSILSWLILIGFMGVALRHESYSRKLLARTTRLRATRAGAYVAILGMLLFIAGTVGREMRKLAAVTLTPGSSAQLRDPFGKRWTLENLGVSRYDALNRQITAIALDVSIDGGSAGVVTSEMRQQIDSRGTRLHRPWTTAGVRGTWPLDLVVFLDDVDPGESARLRFAFNPLVRLVWIGGIMVMIGGCLIIYPHTRMRA